MQCTPCLIVYIQHHEMKGTNMSILNVVECINVALINIKVQIQQELCWVMLF